MGHISTWKTVQRLYSAFLLLVTDDVIRKQCLKKRNQIPGRVENANNLSSYSTGIGRRTVPGDRIIHQQSSCPPPRSTIKTSWTERNVYPKSINLHDSDDRSVDAYHSHSRNCYEEGSYYVGQFVLTEPRLTVIGYPDHIPDDSSLVFGSRSCPNHPHSPFSPSDHKVWSLSRCVRPMLIPSLINLWAE
ncbi:hypothetical protein CDAR_261781 [Caerostris darwini]|uniref:Uncharacterized protein n=1 Tax=Caerostris darwini TaxID=1538125 RepID=A0AAV4V2F0_9ARAC|nr:hypothetical protein CDAR_261781 [Caerostris darwini]